MNDAQIGGVLCLIAFVLYILTLALVAKAHRLVGEAKDAAARAQLARDPLDVEKLCGSLVKEIAEATKAVNSMEARVRELDPKLLNAPERRFQWTGKTATGIPFSKIDLSIAEAERIMKL